MKDKEAEQLEEQCPDLEQDYDEIDREHYLEGAGDA